MFTSQRVLSRILPPVVLLPFIHNSASADINYKFLPREHATRRVTRRGQKVYSFCHLTGTMSANPCSADEKNETESRRETVGGAQQFRNINFHCVCFLLLSVPTVVELFL